MNNSPWSEDKTKTVFQIFECSPVAMQKIEPQLVGTGETEPMRGKTKYPFCMLKIGQAFAVPFNMNIQRGVLENGWRQYSQRTGKKFAVIKHAALNLYEVARIA